MKKVGCPKGLIVASAVCVGLAILGTTGTDIFLASTQWILMAILFAVYALWSR